MYDDKIYTVHICLMEESEMNDRLMRTELLLGEECMERLRKSRVLVFGVGGVGSYVVEALTRSGIGELAIVDKDVVDITNINRQLPAMTTTVGQSKVAVMKERMLQIAPEMKVEARQAFYLPGMAEEFLQGKVDYVVDAVDNVTAKIDLVVQCYERKIPIISSMGAGNKLDPTRFEVADIKKTSVCPLAKVMRRELKKRGVDQLKVVYSKEEPRIPMLKNEAGEMIRANCPGSIAFVPSVVGLIIAGEVVKDIALDRLQTTTK